MSVVSDFDEKSRCLLEKALNTSTDAPDGGARQAFLEYLDHKWRGPGWIPHDVCEAATGRQKDFPCKGICAAIFEITRLASAQGAVLETLWIGKGFLRRRLIFWNKKFQKRSLKLTATIASELFAEMKAWSSSRWERAKAVKCVGAQPGPGDEAMNDGSHPEIQPKNSPQTAQPDTQVPATPCTSEGSPVEPNEPILEEVQLGDNSASLSAPVQLSPNLNSAQVIAPAASPAARVSRIVKSVLNQQNESTEAAEQHPPVASGPFSPGETKPPTNDELSNSLHQCSPPAPKRSARVIDLTDVPDDTPSSKRLREFSLSAETVKAALKDPGIWLDDDAIELLCSALQVLHGGDRLIRVFPLQRMNKSVTAKFKKDLKEHLEASGDIFLISNPGSHWALVALSQISEDVCKAAYHDSLYTAGKAEEAKQEVERWMRLVGIEKGVEFEFQNCPQQRDNSSCGVYAVSCFRRALTNTQNWDLTQAASEERLSCLGMLIGMTPEQKARLPSSYQSTVEDLKVSEQEVDNAKVALLEAQKKVEDAKANLERLERLKDMSDAYVHCSSNERLLGWLEKERIGLETKKERIEQRVEEIDQEKAQLRVEREASRGERISP